MPAMRSLPVLLLALVLSPIALAEETFKHHHHKPISLDTPVPIAVEPTGVTRTFNITARQWDYDISPLPFQAALGDTVVLNLTSRDVKHGFLMERYQLDLNVVLETGKTVTKTFTADKIGDYQFVCTQPSCGAGHSEMGGNFSVIPAVVNPAPTITSVQPSTGNVNGGTVVTITGTNFLAGATVKFGNVSASSVDVQSATVIVATAPPQAAGSVTITVTNSDGLAATSTGFTYIVPAPAINSVSPSSGPSSGNTTITITGANFQSGATVTLGSVPVNNINVISSTVITAVTPPAPAAASQTSQATLFVRNPDGQTASASQGFSYNAVPLAITVISPASGSNAGGGVVSISGTGFVTSGASVTFGGVAGTSLSVIDATTLTVKAPAHANGAVDVALTMNGQTITSLGGFTYSDTPARRRTVKR